MKIAKFIIQATIAICVASTSISYADNNKVNSPDNCKINSCYEDVYNLINRNQAVEDIVYTLEAYKNNFPDENAFNQYLIGLMKSNINNQRVTPVLLDWLTMRNPKPVIVAQIIDLYESKDINKAQKNIFLKSFGNLFSFENTEQITPEMIISIKRGNEIVIQILNNSIDTEEVKVAAGVTKQIMAKEYSVPLIQGAYERLGLNNN